MMIKDFVLKTDRLIIRLFNKNDLERFHYIVSQEDVVRYLPEDVMSRREAEEILDWLIGCYSKNKPEKIIKFTVAVVDKKANEVIGWCGFGPVEYDDSQVELYYGLSREYWGKGLATEAAGAVMKYAFGDVGLDCLVALAAPENKASIGVIEKIGMEHRETVNNLPEKYNCYSGHFVYTMTKKRYFKNRV
jgi:ribosomal-protein-alanine N-acetyltransferase